jgi:hypothetical protein
MVDLPISAEDRTPREFLGSLFGPHESAKINRNRALPRSSGDAPNAAARDDGLTLVATGRHWHGRAGVLFQRKPSRSAIVTLLVDGG